MNQVKYTKVSCEVDIISFGRYLDTVFLCYNSSLSIYSKVPFYNKSRLLCVLFKEITARESEITQEDKLIPRNKNVFRLGIYVVPWHWHLIQICSNLVWLKHFRMKIRFTHVSLLIVTSLSLVTAQYLIMETGKGCPWDWPTSNCVMYSANAAESTMPGTQTAVKQLVTTIIINIQRKLGLSSTYKIKGVLNLYWYSRSRQNQIKPLQIMSSCKERAAREEFWLFQAPGHSNQVKSW